MRTGRDYFVDPADAEAEAREEVVLDVVVASESRNGYLPLKSLEMQVHLLPISSCSRYSRASSS